jgi:hypothetical protein
LNLSWSIASFHGKASVFFVVIAGALLAKKAIEQFSLNFSDFARSSETSANKCERRVGGGSGSLARLEEQSSDGVCCNGVHCLES